MNSRPRALLVMIDGLRPDALNASRTPRLETLRRRGAWTLTGRSVMPSITLPCHMSIFHSVPPTRHGIVTNDWTPMARPLPGLVDIARGQGLRCAFFHNWEPLRNLNTPGTLAFSLFRDNVNTDVNGDQVIAEEAVRYLRSDDPDFLFLYLGTVDIAGHLYGWMSEGYLDQVARVDTTLGFVLDALDSSHTVLVHADHGGHERTHGTDAEEDMRIPWLIAGPGIRSNHALSADVSLLDTAPTLAHVLDLRPHRDWEGRAITEAFAESTA